MAEPLKKFAFDTEFAPDGTIVRTASPLNRRYTNDELEAEKQNAYAKGRDDALAAAERAKAAALASLVERAAAVAQHMSAEAQRIRRDAADLAFIAARKIAGEALAGFGAERAMAAIENAMEALPAGPRLIVRVDGETAEAIAQRVTALCEHHHYPGAVLVRADANARAGDVTLEWADGVVRLSAVEIAERIEASVRAALAAPAAEDAS